MLRRFLPLAFSLFAATCMTACADASDSSEPVVEADAGAIADATADVVVDSALPDTATADAAPADTTVVDTSTATNDASSDASTPEASVSDAAADAKKSDASCASGAIEQEACGTCGKRSRLCDMGAWLEWGACSNVAGLCAPGDTRNVPCERCGTRVQTCSGTCDWVAGACTDQKACAAGSEETRSGTCVDATKTQTRTCGDTCAWSAWSACQ